MELDLDFKKIYSQLDPKEQERLHADWAEVLEMELPEMALTKPNRFKKLLATVETKKVVEALNTKEVIEALNTKEVIEALSTDALAEDLTDEQFEAIVRRRKAKKQQEPTP